MKFPTIVEFGNDKLNQAGKITRSYGRHAYCIFDRFFKDSEFEQKALHSLHATGIATVENYEVHPIPAHTK